MDAAAVRLCCAGVIVSIYALYVEMRKERDPGFVAMCDFNKHMSCSKVLCSRYGRGFGVVEGLLGKEHFLNKPNCITGVIFYIFQLVLSVIPGPWSAAALYYSSVISCVGSVYLAYVLFVVLHDVCVVCIATYVINGWLMYINNQKYHALY